MIRQRTGHWTAIVLGCAAIVLLSLAAAFLLHAHNTTLREMREQAAQTHARLMAQLISQRLSEAVSAGIPLHQLVGVEPFLDHWQTTHHEVTHIAVHDFQGQTLWRSSANAASDDTSDPGVRGDSDEAGITVGWADVMLEGSLLAKVRLKLQSEDIEHSGRTATLLVPAILLISTLAYLAAHFTCAQGPWLRNHGLRMSARWVARGDYRRLLVLPQHKHFDLRVQEVAHAMRDIHERMARMRQLIGSLRRTEPQQLRRDYLDQILLKTEGSDCFTDNEPTIMRLVAAQSQSFWMALLLCLAAVSPLTFVLLVFQNTATTAEHWSQTLPSASLALLVLSATAGWTLFSRLRTTTLIVLILSSLALLLPLLIMLAGGTLHPYGIAAWNGGFAGAALAACTRAQTHPDQHTGFVHALPRLRGAALLAWWTGLLWMAPALGFYTYDALPNALAALALLLPVACVLFFASRWDVAHSPWRARMAPSSLPWSWSWSWPSPRTIQPLRWAALGTATGLVAGQMAHGLAAPDALDAVTLLQQCALGLGGLGTGLVCCLSTSTPTMPNRPPSHRWRLIALVAVMAQLATGLGGNFFAWLPPTGLFIIQILPYLLLGLLLGHGLAQAAHQPQHETSLRLLLWGALGAGLCTAAIMQGLHAWPSLLAALLLTQVPMPWVPRTKAQHAH